MEEWAGRASAGVAPDESDRGKQRQVGDGGGYIDSGPSAMASCKAHPVGGEGGPAASAGNSNGLLRTHRDRRTARHRAGTGGMDEQDAAKRTT